MDKNCISKAINLCIEILSLKLNSAQYCAQCPVLFLIIYGEFGIFDTSWHCQADSHAAPWPWLVMNIRGFNSALHVSKHRLDVSCNLPHRRNRPQPEGFGIKEGLADWDAHQFFASYRASSELSSCVSPYSLLFSLLFPFSKPPRAPFHLINAIGPLAVCIL